MNSVDVQQRVSNEEWDPQCGTYRYCWHCHLSNHYLLKFTSAFTTHSTENICNPVVKKVNYFCKIRFANHHHHHLHITSHIYTSCLIQSVLRTTFCVQPWHHMGILLEIDMGKKREDSSCFAVFVSTTLGAAFKKLHIIMQQSCCNTNKQELYTSRWKNVLDLNGKSRL